MSKPRILWLNVAIFVFTLAIALIAVPLYGFHYGFDSSAYWVAFAFWAWSGLSITAGYHRLWSHKAYDAHPLVQWVLAFGGAMALQNSALHWSSDHRRHHKHVDDNERDPYSAGRGFWFSHIGWMIRDYQPVTPELYNNVRDLQKNPIVMAQHNHYGKWVVASNIALPALLGWFTGDVLGMLLLAGVLRLVLVHHGTFFINSLAHIWGSQPFSDKHSSRDNGILALLTFGEGYHNFHHTFEYDYRNGIQWWQFDPTKWLIRLFEKVGLASKLRRVPQFQIESARLSMQLKASQQLLAQHQQLESWQVKLEEEYHRVLNQLQQYYNEKQRQLKLHKDQLDRNAHSQLADLHYAMEQQVRQWQALRAELTAAMARA